MEYCVDDTEPNVISTDLVRIHELHMCASDRMFHIETSLAHHEREHC